MWKETMEELVTLNHPKQGGRKNPQTNKPNKVRDQALGTCT